MAGNTIGNLFQLTTFGESHGNSIGGIIDGCPAGIEIDFNVIDSELKRRSPKSIFETPRKESEKVEFLSGIFEGKTLGTPIAFNILNGNNHSNDYEQIKDIYRPSHADRVYQEKYGIRDWRGGGRASGRETVSRVVAGAIAKQVLWQAGITIHGFVSQIGEIKLEKDYKELDLSLALNSEVACPDKEISERMVEYISEIKREGDSAGGIIQCIVKNCPIGLGDPVFDRISADLAKSMLSIGSSRGFEFGAGFNSAKMKGSEYLDLYNDNMRTQTNHSGGIQGGISNGEDICFSVAFHPIVSIQKILQVITKTGEQKEIKLGGRHDVCHVPRVVPVVESMAAITILDHLLRYKAYNNSL